MGGPPQQGRGKSEAERLGAPGVHGQLEPGRGSTGRSAGFAPATIFRTSVAARRMSSVGSGPQDMRPPASTKSDWPQPGLGRALDDVAAAPVRDRAGLDDHPPDAVPRHDVQGPLDVAGPERLEGLELHAAPGRGLLQRAQRREPARILGAPQQPGLAQRGERLLQQRQALGRGRGPRVHGDAGERAARAREAGDQARLHGIGHAAEDHGQPTRGLPVLTFGTWRMASATCFDGYSKSWSFPAGKAS